MNLIEITDINAPELDIFARVTEPQLRGYYGDEPGLFLAENRASEPRLEKALSPERIAASLEEIVIVVLPKV